MTGVGELTAALTRDDAAEAARAGNHEGALRLLATLPEDPATDDLRARVHAQCGRWAEAEAAWRRVLDRRPEDPAALAGLALVADIRAGSRRAKPYRLGVVALVLAGTAAAAAAVWVTASPPLASPAASPAPASPAPASTTPVGSAPPLPSAPPGPAGPPAARLDALVGALSGPGVQVSRTPEAVQVVFADALFPPGGTRFTSSGRRALESWAARLHGQPVTVQVLGHGVTLPGGPAEGGSKVALDRASAAAALLSARSGLPWSRVEVRSAEQSQAPHGDSRDRTVTLLVTPA